jgi:nucleoid-associated protein YgaU
VKSSATNQDGFAIPTPTSEIGNDGPGVSTASSTNNSATDSKSKTGTHSQGTKTASASTESTYFIPDSPANEKNSASNSAATDNKDHSTNDGKAGATLDPLAELKEAYKDAKNNASSQDITDTSKSAANQSDHSGKDNEKDLGANTAKVDTNEEDGTSTKGEKKAGDRTVSAVQEPPPIPAGLHNPYQSLPEGPALPANSSNTTDRSPREAGIRKPTIYAPGTANNNATTIGANREVSGVSSGTGAVTISQGTVPATTPNLTPTGSSSGTGSQPPSQSQTGVREREGSERLAKDRDGKVAANSGTVNGLTPGVMPSPRLSTLPPAGDTAPEPNVRLGPPTVGPASNQSGQISPHDPATALPPSNQFAQGPAPNVGQSPTSVNPNQAPGSATGSIQPAGFPAAKVDSYDEETYLCKQGDKFEDISTKFYQTDKYAQALLLFNRNHPRAAAAVRQDPPMLAVGQPVYIPPLRVLEKQHATAIPDHVPVNQTGSLNSTNPDTRSPATPSTGSGAAPGGPTGSQISALPDNRNAGSTPVTGAGGDGQSGGQYAMPPDYRNPGTPSAVQGAVTQSRNPTQIQERTYQVPKNGETFWEISRKTLGNPNRWPEIARLNPQIKPQYPVPGDTKLKMPADARLDPVAPMPVDRVN